jgi:hypothetical protein
VTERILELRLNPDGDRCRIFIYSPSGTPSGFAEETVDLPKGLRADVRELRAALLRGSSSRRGPATGGGLGSSADEKMISELGSRLYSFLFTGDIGNFYKRSLADASQAMEPLRIRLSVEGAAPQLGAIPWETLYDSKSRMFLSLELRKLFSRWVRSDSLNRWSPKRLNILGMISGPKSFQGIPLDPLDVDLERATIESALDPLKKKNKATLSWTTTGSYAEFRRRLANPSPEGWTVFHFIGHGDFDEKDKQKGYLIFEESGGSAGEARYSDNLAPLLTNAGGPQLVILNSCNGARSASGDLFSSTAAALALAGVPAVIAMQFPVSDDMAVAFSAHLYEYLSEGDTVQKALAGTRIELKHEGISEWIAPVLYMQTDDGQLLTL